MEKLLKDHLLTDDKEFVESYEQNPPQIQKVLQYQPGEAIISELSPKDLIQLGSRYLNNISVYEKNMLHFLIRLERLLTWLCEENGIDIQKKFKDDAKAQADLIEKRIQESKENLKKHIKN